MKLFCLAAWVLSVGGHPAPGRNIIVVGFVHWIGWFDLGSRKITAEINGSPVYAPTLFGPGRSAWNLCSFDATETEPYLLVRSNPNGHADSWPLTVRRLKELGIPATGRYDNTHEEFYTGAVVGFDRQDPLVAFGKRILRFKNGLWSNYPVSGWDTNGRMIEVRDDASIVLEESANHVYEIAGSIRTDLGRGQLGNVIGVGSRSLLVCVSDGLGESPRLRLWNITGATPKRLGQWSATGAVLASDGKIYLESHGGVDQTSRHKAFFGWTKLQLMNNSGRAKPIRIAGEVYVSDVDPKTHRLWGVRAKRGHMGEPFIEVNYRTGRQKTVEEATTHSVGRYERIAFVESLY